VKVKCKSYNLTLPRRGHKVHWIVARPSLVFSSDQCANGVGNTLNENVIMVYRERLQKFLTGKVNS
jgi:hypothetical protein